MILHLMLCLLQICPMTPAHSALFQFVTNIIRAITSHCCAQLCKYAFDQQCHERSVQGPAKTCLACYLPSPLAHHSFLADPVLALHGNEPPPMHPCAVELHKYLWRLTNVPLSGRQRSRHLDQGSCHEVTGSAYLSFNVVYSTCLFCVFQMAKLKC